MNVAAALQAASAQPPRKSFGALFAEIVTAWLAHNRRIFESGGFRH